MGNRLLGLKLIILTVFMLSFVFWSGNGVASEFSADMVFSGQMMSGQGKIWIKDHKMRQEFGNADEKMILLMDLDEGYSYVLMPAQKMYMKNKIEAKGDGFHPENFMSPQQGMMKGDVKKVGSGKIMGYDCDEYLIEFQNKQMGSMTMWFSDDLGIPLKSEYKSAMGGMVQEIKNIKKERVKDSLFELPAGYQEMQIPAMPGMPKQ